MDDNELRGRLERLDNLIVLIIKELRLAEFKSEKSELGEDDDIENEKEEEIIENEKRNNKSNQIRRH